MKRPVAVAAVIAAGVCLVAAAAGSDDEAEAEDTAGGSPPAVPGTEIAPATHGMEIHGADLHVIDWNAWMQIAPRAVEVSIQEVGTDPVALATNVFRRLFPAYPWPPPMDSGLCDKWEVIVRAIATSVGRPMGAKLEAL